MNYFGSIFAIVVCIAMSAYFSATETAFSSLNKTRLKVFADNGNKRAALALKLSEDYDKPTPWSSPLPAPRRRPWSFSRSSRIFRPFAP